MWEESAGAGSRCCLFLCSWPGSSCSGSERNCPGMFVNPAVLCPLPRDSSTLDPMECMDTAEEQRVHSPPASLVPRIHVILAQKLQHINPLLPACLNEEESKTCECLNSEHFPGHLNKYCFAQRQIPQEQGLNLNLIKWKSHAMLHRMQMFVFVMLHFYLAEINVVYVEFGFAFYVPNDFTKLFSHKI